MGWCCSSRAAEPRGLRAQLEEVLRHNVLLSADNAALRASLAPSAARPARAELCAPGDGRGPLRQARLALDLDCISGAHWETPALRGAALAVVCDYRFGDVRYTRHGRLRGERGDAEVLELREHDTARGLLLSGAHAAYRARDADFNWYEARMGFARLSPLLFDCAARCVVFDFEFLDSPPEGHFLFALFGQRDCWSQHFEVQTAEDGALNFTVSPGGENGWEHYREVTTRSCIRAGVAHSVGALLTVEGELRIYVDGALEGGGVFSPESLLRHDVGEAVSGYVGRGMRDDCSAPAEIAVRRLRVYDGEPDEATFVKVW
ncbi:hypothetical protein M885DRAFT_575884 [Pelagophyceae sp. CCMP2097]|nr:hypothetical protein M885DRAFT_575884 [Pelagophyceae sp. CCMP2097]